jgi:hypothetical protein
MTDHSSHPRASLIVSSEVMSGRRIAEVLDLDASQIVVKGTPTEQGDLSEHPFHIAMFTSPNVEHRLERHLASLLRICEQRQAKLLSLMQNCKIHVHCTYLVYNEGGWTLTPDLCRRMASLPIEYVFTVDRREAPDGR